MNKNSLIKPISEVSFKPAVYVRYSGVIINFPFSQRVCHAPTDREALIPAGYFESENEKHRMEVGVNVVAFCERPRSRVSIKAQ